MKLKDLFTYMIEEGIKADPRGEAVVRDLLERRHKDYAGLCDAEKEFFDQDRLSNPFDDSRLLHGDPESDILHVMVGIDMDTSELLLADRLNQKGTEKIDLVISHHPQGSAFANFYEVMDMQADLFHRAGVPINICEGLVEERKKDVGRRVHSSNHQKAVDAARALGMPFLCMHTPADNHAAMFLERLFADRKPVFVRDVVDILMSLAEYRTARQEHAGPVILLGKPDHRAGRILVDMTGGTEGPKDMMDYLLTAGIGTIVGMHMSEDHYKKLQGRNMNVIIAGHIASDSLGLNLLLDKLVRKGIHKVSSCSGFRRVQR